MMDIIDNILNSLQGLLQLGGQDGLWLPMTLVFATVILFSVGVVYVLRPTAVVARRMKGTVSRDEISEQVKQVSLRKDSASNKALDQIFKRLEKYLVKADEQETSALRERLLQAGIMAEGAPRYYYVIRVLLAILLPVGFLVLVPFIAPDMKSQTTILTAAGLAFGGLYLPYRWLQSKIEARQLAITEGFPDGLDLLVICVEAGLSLNAAFVRVSQELSRAHPVLAEQFTLVTLELRAGKSRQEALRNLVMRTGVDDVRNFVTLMIQSEALGADLAQTLSIQSEEMRVLRMLRAEEKAHKLPVKLSIPLVLFILPAMFAVVLGPAIISIVRDILPHMGAN
jgi:tight adherence protein C